MFSDVSVLLTEEGGGGHPHQDAGSRCVIVYRPPCFNLAPAHLKRFNWAPSLNLRSRGSTLLNT